MTSKELLWFFSFFVAKKNYWNKLGSSTIAFLSAQIFLGHLLAPRQGLLNPPLVWSPLPPDRSIWHAHGAAHPPKTWRTTLHTTNHAVENPCSKEEEISYCDEHFFFFSLGSQVTSYPPPPPLSDYTPAKVLFWWLNFSGGRLLHSSSTKLCYQKLIGPSSSSFLLNVSQIFLSLIATWAKAHFLPDDKWFGKL